MEGGPGKGEGGRGLLAHFEFPQTKYAAEHIKASGGISGTGGSESIDTRMLDAWKISIYGGCHWLHLIRTF